MVGARRTSIALMALAAMVTAAMPAPGQDDPYRYSMQTGYKPDERARPQDGILWVKLEDLNRLCFDYEVKSRVVNDSDPASLWAQRFGLRPEGTEPQEKGAQGEGDTNLAGFGDDAGPDLLLKNLDAAVEQLQRALAEREAYLTEYESMVCAHVYWSVNETIAEEWEKRFNLARVDSVRMKAEELADLIAPQIGANGDLKKRFDRLKERLDKAKERFPALRRRARDARLSLVDLGELVAVPVIRSTRRVEIDVEATGREEFEAVKGVKEKRTITIPVQRTFVFRQSIGFLVSTLETPDFGRTNLQSAEPASNGMPASTYSTYVDRDVGESSTIAPLYLVSALWKWKELSFGPGAGVALRTTDKKTVLDFTLGGVVGLADFLFVTLGWHRGQVEELLLGDPAEVRLEPVATSVTDADAVGRTWKSGVALGVTVELP